MDGGHAAKFLQLLQDEMNRKKGKNSSFAE
jgi:hypothetical protein